MSDRPDVNLEDLLSAQVVPRRPRRYVRSAAWLLAFLSALGLAALLLSRGEPVGGVAATTTVLAPDEATLVDNDHHNGLLLHPAKIPAGLELCERQQGRPTAGDRYCDPTSEARWIEITLVESRYRPTAVTPSAAIAKADSAASDYVEYTIAISDQYCMVFAAAGVDGGVLAAVLESIPAVGSRAVLVPTQQRQLTSSLGDQAALVLLGAESSGGYVEEDGSYVLVKADGLSLWADSVSAVPVWDVLVGTLDATVDSQGEHWMVTGRRDGDRLSIVVWIQRGRVWQLTGTTGLDALRQTAHTIQKAIEPLS